jgi:PhnB protein
MTGGALDLEGARPHLAVWLQVPDAEHAVRFYASAFGATERYRLDQHGMITVVQLAIGQADFWVQRHTNRLPTADGCSPRLILTVNDPDTLFGRALAAGATEVTPVSDRYEWRSGSLTDPFGYSWDLARPPSTPPPTAGNGAVA